MEGQSNEPNVLEDGVVAGVLMKSVSDELRNLRGVLSKFLENMAVREDFATVGAHVMHDMSVVFEEKRSHGDYDFMPVDEFEELRHLVDCAGKMYAKCVGRGIDFVTDAGVSGHAFNYEKVYQMLQTKLGETLRLLDDLLEIELCTACLRDVELNFYEKLSELPKFNPSWLPDTTMDGSEIDV